MLEGVVGVFDGNHDKRQKTDETLERISQMTLGSWNYKEHDPSQFRHYGPTAQEFFAAFGDDALGTVGANTTINNGDMAGIMMIVI